MPPIFYCGVKSNASFDQISNFYHKKLQNHPSSKSIFADLCHFSYTVIQAMLADLGQFSVIQFANWFLEYANVKFLF